MRQSFRTLTFTWSFFISVFLINQENYVHTSWVPISKERILQGNFEPRPMFSTIYYISTTGNDANSGTSISTPWQHIEKIASVSFVAGDIVYIRAGTYNSTAASSVSHCIQLTSQNGNSSNHITISAYPDDFHTTGGRVTFNCTNVAHDDDCFGITLTSCSWIDFSGIYVKGPSQTVGGGLGDGTINGSWWSRSSSNIIYANCEASNSMTGFRLDDGVSCNYLNCDAHDCDDPLTGGTTGPHNNSDGFGRTASGNTATGTTYFGCRSWYNADDGWDCFNTSGKPISPET